MDNNTYKEFCNQDYKSLSDLLFSLDPYTFTLLGTTLGFGIATTLTVNQQNSLGNFFSLIGQILQTLNAQDLTVSQAPRNFSDFKPYLQKDTLEDEVKYIKEEILKIINETYGNDKI